MLKAVSKNSSSMKMIGGKPIWSGVELHVRLKLSSISNALFKPNSILIYNRFQRLLRTLVFMLRL